MAHYDPSAPTQLRVDACPVGLGAVLSQTQHGVTRPIAYASRTLSNVERRYSQTEKEALAVVWGCEKYHLYLYGTEFIIYTDHKPLEIIYNPKRKPPARIERWVLRLQSYRFKIQHVPGPENPADVVSRLPLPHQPHVEQSIAEEYINYVATNAVPKAMTLAEIEKASLADPLLQRVHACISSGIWPEQPDLKPFSQVSDELSIYNGVILRGTRIIIPGELQKSTLNLAHQGHQGVVKTKQLLRQKVWWLGIDKDTDSMISQCLPCQAQGPRTNPEPLRMSPMPTDCGKLSTSTYADLFPPESLFLFWSMPALVGLPLKHCVPLQPPPLSIGYIVVVLNTVSSHHTGLQPTLPLNASTKHWQRPSKQPMPRVSIGNKNCPSS